MILALVGLLGTALAHGETLMVGDFPALDGAFTPGTAAGGPGYQTTRAPSLHTQLRGQNPLLKVPRIWAAYHGWPAARVKQQLEKRWDAGLALSTPTASFFQR